MMAWMWEVRTQKESGLQEFAFSRSDCGTLTDLGMTRGETVLRTNGVSTVKHVKFKKW